VKKHGKVIRVGPLFATRLETLKQEYSTALGHPVKMTRLTDELSKSLESDGFWNFLIVDAKRKQRRRGGWL